MPRLEGSWQELRRYQTSRRELKESLLRKGIFPKDPRAFNEAIGLPKHPKTNLPHPLLPYQEAIIKDRHKDILIVKSTKIGMTEAILRRIIQRSVDGEYAGYQVMLGAQRKELAIRNVTRIQEIFRQSEILRPLVQNDESKTYLELTNGTVIMEMPGSETAMRGYDRVKCVYLTEAAHHGLLDDEGILAAALGRLANTDGDLLIDSTPKGQRGFFYKRHMQIEDGTIIAKQYVLPYFVALGTLISQEFIDDRAKGLGPLFPQEFLADFLPSQQAAISEDIIEGGFEEYEADIE